MWGSGGGVDAVGLPLGYVVVCDVCEVEGVGGVACAVCDLGHGFDAYDAFEGEVGIVSAGALLVLGWTLGSGGERLTVRSRGSRRWKVGIRGRE